MGQPRPARALAALVVAALAAAVVATACGGADEPDGPAERLAAQVVAAVADGAEEVSERLDELGVVVTAEELRSDLDPSDVVCPPVRDPEVGDRATCDIELRAADVVVDVEFGEGGSVAVIAVEVRRLRPGGDDLEGAVGGLVAERLGVGVSEVLASCPDDDLPDGPDAEGTEVRCEVVVDDEAPREVTFELDADGALAPTEAILAAADVEAFLATTLEAPAEGPVDVTCGEHPLVVAVPGGDPFECEAVRTDSEPFDVLVQALSTDGELAYEVVAP